MSGVWDAASTKAAKKQLKDRHGRWLPSAGVEILSSRGVLKDNGVNACSKL